MKESTLQKKMLDVLNSIDGCKALPVTVGMFGKKGEPDIYGCLNGQMFVIEVKLPGNLPSKIQHRRLSEWSDAGAKAVWLDSMDSFYKFIKEIEE